MSFLHSQILWKSYANTFLGEGRGANTLRCDLPAGVSTCSFPATLTQAHELSERAVNPKKTSLESRRPLSWVSGLFSVDLCASIMGGSE